MSATAAVLLWFIYLSAFFGPLTRAAGILAFDVLLTGLALVDTWYFRFYGDVAVVSALRDKQVPAPSTARPQG